MCLELQNVGLDLSEAKKRNITKASNKVMSDVSQAVEVILQNKCHSKLFHCRVFWLQEY